MNAPAASETPTPAEPVVSAAILAGGRARRLQGQDKSALAVGGQPIIERQLPILRQLTTDLLIVARDADRFARYDVRVVPDLIADAGPLGGLYTALSHTSSAYTLIVACDMPFVSLELLRHLARRAQGWEAAVPRTTHGYHPLCAVYARTVAPVAKRRIEDGARSMIGLLGALRVAEVGPDELARFDPDDVMLSNVNTPHDYRQACSRALDR